MSRTPIASRAYERRRLRLCAREARGCVLDLGHAQLPNPFLDQATTVGLDRIRPDPPSGYSYDVVGSVEELPGILDGRRFDTVIAGELIEHLERPYDFLRSIRDVLRVNGRLVLSTPNPIGFPTLLLEATRSTRWFYTAEHTYYFTPRWVRRMLERTGYELERLVPVGIWLPIGHVPWCPLWCSYQIVYVACRSS